MLPLFSLLIVTISIIEIIKVSKNGILYVFGWTFIPILLFLYNTIGVIGFLADLILIAILIIYLIVN